MQTFMEEAFKEARAALADGEVPVGCVFVRVDEVIARGRNHVNATKNATRHAEFQCIDQVLELCAKQSLARAERCEMFAQISVFVTVEPCIMCSAALHELGVKEIWYGCSNDRFGGQTVIDVPHIVGKKIPVFGGIRSDDAMELLKEFYKGENPSAPQKR